MLRIVISFPARKKQQYATRYFSLFFFFTFLAQSLFWRSGNFSVRDARDLTDLGRTKFTTFFFVFFFFVAECSQRLEANRFAEKRKIITIRDERRISFGKRNANKNVQTNTVVKAYRVTRSTNAINFVIFVVFFTDK